VCGELLIFDTNQQFAHTGYGPPEMTPVSTTLGEIFQFEVVDPKRSLMELRSILCARLGRPSVADLATGPQLFARPWRLSPLIPNRL
jgi:hypothetical protein